MLEVYLGQRRDCQISWKSTEVYFIHTNLQLAEEVSKLERDRGFVKYTEEVSHVLALFLLFFRHLIFTTAEYE